MVKILGRIRRCYIEELPDEVLENIVSRLTSNEAAQSRAVSRRWSNLWTLSSCRNLDFKFTYNKHIDDVIHRLHLAMKKHTQPQVDHLRIAFHDHMKPLDHRFFGTLTELFEFGNAKQVQSLVIDIKASVAIPNPLAGLFSSHEIAIPTIADNSWDRLTTVSLKSVIMFDWDVHQLLSVSPNLETLLLDNIPFTKFEVKDTIPKLKRLEILNCAVFRRVHIMSAPNLESFKHVPLINKNYKSLKRLTFKRRRKKSYIENDNLIETNISLHFEHASKLGSIYLGGPICRYLLWMIQEYAPQLQKLQLNMDLNCDHEECGKSWTFPTLGNLEQLQLIFTSTKRHHRDYDQMNTIIDIVHSCPCLEKLMLKYEIQNVDTADENYCYHSRGPNEFLQEVEIVGWSGLMSEIELVHYLIRTSPKLQRLSLDPTPPHPKEASWIGVYSPVKRAEHEIKSAALAAQQLVDCLHNKLPV